MRNIDKFDIMVGKILGKLYSEFPVKCELYCEDFGVKDSICASLMDEEVAGDLDELQFFNDTVVWLIENDFIHSEQNGTGSFYQSVLSSKGLRLLKTTPKSLNENKKSIGEYMSEFATTSREEMLKGLINKLFLLSM